MGNVYHFIMRGTNCSFDSKFVYFFRFESGTLGYTLLGHCVTSIGNFFLHVAISDKDDPVRPK